MTVSELIEQLQNVLETNGDLPVKLNASQDADVDDVHVYIDEYTGESEVLIDTFSGTIVVE